MKWKHVTWKPAARERYGEAWWASSDGCTRGYVKRLRSGRYEAYIGGRQRRYCSTMNEAGRVVVAHINNIYPSQLPR